VTGATKAILWGARGHAVVVRAILQKQGTFVDQLFDNDQQVASPMADLAVAHGNEGLQGWLTGRLAQDFGFVVCIGGTRGGDRVAISERLRQFGLAPLEVIHDRSFVADSVERGVGIQVLAMAALCENARIGDFSIVNTSASVDHGTVLGRGVHVMPGATIAGECIVEDFASIGSNATILPRLRIGTGAVVGAGAVVTRDVAPGRVVIGVPAQERSEA
jgi:sugar O-acyltransferase (sialic acid O-acetyltransferase NeuD family)